MAIALISPLGTALALGLLALALGLWRWRRLSWQLAAIALLWLWVWSTPAASLWLRAGLESRYPPLALQAVPSAQAIVVLGGALSPPSAGRLIRRFALSMATCSMCAQDLGQVVRHWRSTPFTRR